MIVVHVNSIQSAASEQPAATIVQKRLEADEAIPLGAIWIDLVDPTVEEDRKVEDFIGGTVPIKSDPDYTEPLEAHYAENGTHYMHASILSEPDETPDITGVMFVMTPAVLVTVHYDPAGSFDLFGKKLCKSPPQALSPDAVVVGLINTVLNCSASALSAVGNKLEQIGNFVFKAKGDQAQRSRIYANTLDALGREHKKISNLRESMVTIERLLLFLLAEGRPSNATKAVSNATKLELRDKFKAVVAELDRAASSAAELPNITNIVALPSRFPRRWP